MPNNPNLKQWSYETTTNNSYDIKFDTVDPIQKAARVHCNDQIQYLMPQWEKVYGMIIKHFTISKIIIFFVVLVKFPKTNKNTTN